MNEKPASQTEAASGTRLHGWDDEKVYFWIPGEGERCVSDEPELLRQLEALCADYFRQAPKGKND